MAPNPTTFGWETQEIASYVGSEVAPNQYDANSDSSDALP